MSQWCTCLEPDLEGIHVLQSLDIDVPHCLPCCSPRAEEPGTPCPQEIAVRLFVPSSNTTGAALRLKLINALVASQGALTCIGVLEPQGGRHVGVGLDLDRRRCGGAVVERRVLR
jgi:hypothetical protein